ncbi:Glycosyl hydrolases family 18 [uncultured archaeon]|nr:Glycosyl hydrolases family 18 [uncultured archaeon]
MTGERINKNISRAILSLVILTALITINAGAADNSSSSKVIYAFWPYWTDFQSYQPDWDILSYVSYFSIEANPDGTLNTSNIGTNYYNVRDAAHAHNVSVTLTIESFNPDVQDSILAGNQKELAVNILQKIQYYGADGVSIDFEGIRDTNSITHESNSILMGNFMRTLYDTLKNAGPGYHISFAVQHGVNSVYHNATLSQYTDAMFLMGYDYHWLNGPSTGAVSPFNDATQQDVEDSVKMLEKYYPSNKIILGLPFHGYDWPSSSDEPGASTTGAGTAVYMKNATVNAKTYGRIWDSVSHTPWYRYQSSGTWHQVWYDDDESLGLKLDYVNSENLRGTGFWALGYEGNNATIWNVVREKSKAAPATPGFELTVFLAGFFFSFCLRSILKSWRH